MQSPRTLYHSCMGPRKPSTKLRAKKRAHSDFTHAYKELGVGVSLASMSTAKAKLHLLMTKLDQRYHYETRQVTHAEAAPVKSSDSVAELGVCDLGKPELFFVSTLYLPDEEIVQSSSFRRKKDAEQDAALLGLRKLNVPFEPVVLQPTISELWEGLVNKVAMGLTDQMMFFNKPMAEHFRAAVQQQGSRFGLVPTIVLTIVDTKIMSQCKSIDQLAENNPAHAASLVWRAVAECPAVRISDDGLWIGRSDPLSAELVTNFLLSLQPEEPIAEPPESRSESECVGSLPQLATLTSQQACQFKAVYIPACAEEELRTVNLTATSESYYLDIIAHELALPDAGHVLFTRQIGKAPDGTRIYWPLKEKLPVVDVPCINQPEPFMEHLDPSSKHVIVEAPRLPEGQMKNERASFLVGHHVDGDAILATAGSTWQSDGRCIYADLNLSCFHRLMLGRTPWGAYKLSRNSILVAELPKMYSCRTNWQGASPKALLTDYCHQQHLPDPEYSCTGPQCSLNNRVGEGCPDVAEHTNSLYSNEDETCSKDQLHVLAKQGRYHCKILVGSPDGDSRTQFESDGFFRSRFDATQSAALNAVLHYDRWSGAGCLLSYFQKHEGVKSSYVKDDCKHRLDVVSLVELEGRKAGISYHVVAEDATLGDRPPPGSMVYVSYNVSLSEPGTGWLNTNSVVSESKSDHILEVQAEFKFELGVGAVIAPFDACVSQALVGQTLQFNIPTELLGILFTASNSNSECQSGWMVLYTVKLIKYEEPLEERIESSHFTPPLSKQRNDFARALINALEAKFLVDLGCGSGSLLEVLLKEPNTLEHIVGIDTSRKALVRAAKALNTTLMKHIPGDTNPWPSLQKVVLYEGSIADMDPCLQSPDLATCIEVVEHMDPEPLQQLGESVLGQLAPRVLLVSTPNIEYNPIIRGLDWDPESNSLLTTAVKKKSVLVDAADASNFRNHDHRFEWTRDEFRQWASCLASQFNYQVSFTGVGGDGEDDQGSPGFATQIAIFAQNPIAYPTSSLTPCQQHHQPSNNNILEFNSEENAMPPFKELWRWTPPGLKCTGIKIEEAESEVQIKVC